MRRRRNDEKKCEKYRFLESDARAVRVNFDAARHETASTSFPPT